MGAWFSEPGFGNKAASLLRWGASATDGLEKIDIQQNGWERATYAQLTSHRQSLVRRMDGYSRSTRDDFYYYQLKVNLPKLQNWALGSSVANHLWIRMSVSEIANAGWYSASDGPSSTGVRIIAAPFVRDQGSGTGRISRSRTPSCWSSVYICGGDTFHRNITAALRVIVRIPKTNGSDLSKFKWNLKLRMRGRSYSGNQDDARLLVPIQLGTYTPMSRPKPRPTACATTITGLSQGSGSSADPYIIPDIVLPYDETKPTNAAFREVQLPFRVQHANVFSVGVQQNLNPKRVTEGSNPGNYIRFNTEHRRLFEQGRIRLYNTRTLLEPSDSVTFGYSYFYNCSRGASFRYIYFQITIRKEEDPRPCGDKTCNTGYVLNEDTCECEILCEDPTQRRDAATNTCVDRCPDYKVWDAQTNTCICPTPPQNREFKPGTTTCETQAKCVQPYVRNPLNDTCVCPDVPDGFERVPGAQNCETRRICNFEWVNGDYNTATEAVVFNVKAGAQEIEGPKAVNCYDEKILQYTLNSVSPRNALRITTEDTFGTTRNPSYKLRTQLGYGEVATARLVATDGDGGRIVLPIEVRAGGVTCGAGQVCSAYSDEQSGVCIACGCPPLRDGYEWVQPPAGLPSCRSRPIPTRLRWESGHQSGATISHNIAQGVTSVFLPRAITTSGFNVTYRTAYNNHGEFVRNGFVLNFPIDYFASGERRTIQWYASAGDKTISLNIRMAAPSGLAWEGCHTQDSRNPVEMDNAHSMQLRVPRAVSPNGIIRYRVSIQQERRLNVRYINEQGNPHILVEPIKSYKRRDNGEEIYSFENTETRNFTLKFTATDGFRTIDLYYDVTNNMDANLGYPDGFVGIAEGYSPGETFFFDRAGDKEYTLPITGGKIFLMAPTNDSEGDTTGITLNVTSDAPASQWTGTSLLGMGTKANAALQRTQSGNLGFTFPAAQQTEEDAQALFSGLVDTRKLAATNAGYVLDINGLPPGNYVFRYTATKGSQTLFQRLDVRVSPCDSDAPPPKPPPNVNDSLAWADDCYNSGQTLTYNISPAFTRINLPEATGGTERILYEITSHSGFDYTYLPYEHQMVISPVVGTQRYTLTAISGDNFITAEITINIINEYEDASPDPLQRCELTGDGGGRVAPNPLGKPSMYVATHFAGIMRTKNVVTRIPGAVISGYEQLTPGKFYGVDRNGDLATIPIDPQTAQTPGLYFLRAVSRYELVIMPTLNGTVIIDPAQLGGRVS